MNVIKSFPTHIQFMKTMAPGGSSSYTLRMLNSRKGEELKNYLSEYSYHNFNSSFKTWQELELKEQSSFINNYTKLHERYVTPYHHPNSLRNTVKMMYNQNKDVNYYFAFLYSILKETADDLIAENNEVISRRDELLEDLLIKKWN